MPIIRWTALLRGTARWSFAWFGLCAWISCFLACTGQGHSETDAALARPISAEASTTQPTTVGEGEPTKGGELTKAKIQRIQRFCGDCHPLPMAKSFPKSNWEKEVQQGFNFYHDSKRTDLEVPEFEDTVSYFREAAPEKVIVPRADGMKPAPSPVRFVSGKAVATGEVGPFTAHLVWDNASKSLLHTDMLGGTLRQWTPNPDSKAEMEGADELIGTGRSICRVHLCDWNQDGRQDYLVGDLGTFTVGDHHYGSVALHLALEAGGYKKVLLAENLARVVEAKPFDYDDDGDLDVLVAEFGWRTTGSLKLLRNVGGTADEPQMNVEVLDPRHGCLGIEIADLDGDSKQDFVVAYGQEFESVEAYLNRGAGKFEKQLLLKLPDPSFNSSAFQVVDVDRDGLLDIVHVCGDIMDTYIPKPFHGLRVIKNQGNGKWEEHDLGLLIGALQSTVADFDGDGDLDIAAVGLFQFPTANDPGAFDSICWWEQQDNLQFTRHSIERDHCSHAACTSADVNGDGRIDLIVGECRDAVDKAAFRVFLNLPSE